jgi:hypothetical protein
MIRGKVCMIKMQRLLADRRICITMSKTKLSKYTPAMEMAK